VRGQADFLIATERMRCGEGRPVVLIDEVKRFDRPFAWTYARAPQEVLRLRDIRDSSHHVLMQSDDIRQKGLNLAVSDVFYLSRALAATYKTAKT
jgi:hypothetical protein